MPGTELDEPTLVAELAAAAAAALLQLAVDAVVLVAEAAIALETVCLTFFQAE